MRGRANSGAKSVRWESIAAEVVGCGVGRGKHGIRGKMFGLIFLPSIFLPPASFFHIRVFRVHCVPSPPSDCTARTELTDVESLLADFLDKKSRTPARW